MTFKRLLQRVRTKGCKCAHCPKVKDRSRARAEKGVFRKVRRVSRVKALEWAFLNVNLGGTVECKHFIPFWGEVLFIL